MLDTLNQQAKATVTQLTYPNSATSQTCGDPVKLGAGLSLLKRVGDSFIMERLRVPSVIHSHIRQDDVAKKRNPALKAPW